MKENCTMGNPQPSPTLGPVSTKAEPRLGLDLGSHYLKIVSIVEGRIAGSVHRPHRGNPVQALKEELPKFLDGQPALVGITGALAGLVTDQLGARPVDLTQALMHAVGREAPDARAILDVGGGSVTLISLDEDGRFLGMAQNSLCAAGTGSFLDEQAGRLGISAESMALASSSADPPPVAARCAVFAKSDLIHLQQQGVSRELCWSGLCKGMANNLLQTLLRGRPLPGRTVVVGGVARNPEVVRWLQASNPDLINTYPDAHLAAAVGAALLAEASSSFDHAAFANLVETEVRSAEAPAARQPLRLLKTKYPSFAVAEEYKDEAQNEVRVTRLEPGLELRAFLGIDIGSTSTKLALVDEAGRVRVDIYRRTLGDPLDAVRKLFAALLALAEKKNCRFQVLGVGTTGSGRQMVGRVIGADRIVNEITAHVRAAAETDPAIDTIFEIGGQDAKYVHTQNGQIREANLNYVCAAGTGSFVEEQARKLDYRIEEVGEAVMGIAPPHTSDRCTVFMEQDVSRLIRQGHSRVEALAAVHYSVVQNYLHKVVGQRPWSRERVFFMGATARNRGLVAAFENLLGVEVVVSPYSHVMGAWGVALIAREHSRLESAAPRKISAPLKRTESHTRFKGLDLSGREIKLRGERCELCVNRCAITHADIQGESESPSWGYLCGRDPEATQVRKAPQFRHFRKHLRMLKAAGRVDLPPDAPAVALPQGLTGISMQPLWRSFFGALGFRFELSPATDERIRRQGIAWSSGEFCFPVKLAFGHLRALLDRCDSAHQGGGTAGPAPAEDGNRLAGIFIPQVISSRPNAETSNALFCPYVQSYSSLSASALRVHGYDSAVLIQPVVDLRWPDKKQVKELSRVLGPRLGCTAKQIEKAWAAGLKTQADFDAACRAEGEKALRELAEEEKPGIVIAGRPYNCYDAGANLDLPQKIAETGHTVIPLEWLPLDLKRLGPEFENLFWNYAQRILAGLRYVQEHERLFAVYLSNFNCGPDSFNLAYAEQVMGRKPLLILELDEHGADAGYLTRVEAFLDSLPAHRPEPQSPRIHLPAATADMFRARTIWVPNMHPYGGPLAVAAFRGAGYDARLLPLETDSSFETGRRTTRGSECLPTVTTIGSLLATLRRLQADPKQHAYFMPTATGPCRFGQYALKHRMILNAEGFEDVLIMSPSSVNNYQGLDEPLRRKIWAAFLAGDALMKLRCRLKPYEKYPGETERAVEEEIQRLSQDLEQDKKLLPEFRRSAERIARIETVPGRKPLVGVVGEIYVRCNLFTNDRVIEAIERFGGEVWLAPIAEWFLYTAHIQSWSANQELLNFTAKGLSLLQNRFMAGMERDFYRAAGELLAERHEPPVAEVVAAGEKYLPINFEGEAIITLGRAVKFAEQGASMVVNCAPFGCMPGTLTSAIFQEIQDQLGVPMVTLFYDGEPGLNERLATYLARIEPKEKVHSAQSTVHGEEETLNL
jgi:predicted CoA-substrate-specific enzyme activase